MDSPPISSTQRSRSSLSTGLCTACQHKNKDEVLELLQQGADPNSNAARDLKGKTPLHYACEYGWLDVVELLLNEHKCDPEVIANKPLTATSGVDQNSLQRYYSLATPLHFACKHGQLEVIEMLIERFQCNPNATDSLKLTPLHYACEYGQTEIVNMMVKKYHCNPNVRDSSEMTPLHHACLNGESEVVELLANIKECELNAVDKHGKTPLSHALDCKYVDIAKILFVCASDPNHNIVADSDGNTPLHNACSSGDLDSVKFLLREAKCNPNTQNKNGITPLHVSVSTSVCVDPRIIEELTVHSTDPNMSNNDGNTPLHIACYLGKSAAVSYLLTIAKSNPNIKNKAGLTPLQLTSPSEHSHIIKELVLHGADANVVDRDGNTVLHIACYHRQFDSVKCLLALSKCDLNVKNKAGSTALQIFINSSLLKNPHSWFKRDIDIAVKLLTCGAKSNVVDSNDNTPLHIACSTGVIGLVKRVKLAMPKCNPNVKNKHGLTPLHVTSPNHFLIIKELVEHGADPSVTDSDGNTLLHKACRAEQLESVQYLLSAAKSNPNVKNKDGLTPLQVTFPHCFHIIKELIKHGANPNVVYVYGTTPLHIACFIEDIDFVKLVLAMPNCNLNVKNNLGLTPLQVASPKHLLIIKELIEHGADPSVTDSDGNTLLHKACLTEQLETVIYHLSATKCDPNVKNKVGLTPLAITIPQCSLIIKELIEHGANPNVADNDGSTPLHNACQSGEFDSVKFILSSKKCDPNSWNKDSLTPLQVTSPEHFLIIKELIERGANPNVVDIYGDTPLHRACQAGQLESVKYILSAAKNKLINTKNVNGLTPLHITCNLAFRSYAKHYIIKELIAHGANPNIVDRDGNTPLHDACKHGQLNTFKRLLAVAECDTNAKNNDGLTPLQVAMSHKTSFINFVIEEFIAHNADVNVVDSDGSTPLHNACQSGEFDSVKFILSSEKCDPNSWNKESLTPLQVTSPEHFLIIKELIERGANPNVADTYGDTPLHKACQAGQLKSVKYLLSAAKYNLDTKNNSGLTPLQIACKLAYRLYAKYDIIKELIAHGANPNIVDRDGNTPLHDACKHGQLNTFKCLLAVAECDTNAKNNDGLTPLQVAMSFKVSFANYVIEEFIAHNADVNVFDSDGNTPLHKACQTGYSMLKCVMCLLTLSKCDPNIQNKAGLTPLQTTHLGQSEVIKELIAHGANPNVTDRDGNTLLHKACLAGQLDFVRCLLILAKCDPNVENKAGLTSLQITFPEHPQIIKELTVYSADPNVADSDGNSPLHKACQAGELDSMKCLLEVAKSDPHVKNKAGLTPLQLIPRWYSNMIKEIIRYGANPNVVDKYGNTPLHNACKYGQLTFAKFLLAEAKCDPAIMNFSGQYPLQVTSLQHHHIIKELVTHGAKTDVADSDGNTPLHKACQATDGLHAVMHILTASDCDPNVKNKDGLTPLQVTPLNSTSIIRELIRHGAKASDMYKNYKKVLKRPLQPPVKVFVIGNPSVGKSTLTAALQRETSFFSRKKVTGVDTKTAGVVPHEFESKEYGYATFYDFAGQREFYGSHAALLQNTILSSPPIFLMVVDLCESEDEIMKTILYWLTFLENQCASVSCEPHFIIVGSHADLLKERGEDPNLKCNHLKPSVVIPYSKFVFAGIIPMDCQYPESRGMTELRQCLKTSCNTLRPKETITFNAHCFYVYLVDNFRDKLALTVEEIQAQIKSEESLDTATEKQNVTSFIPDGLYPLCKICDELNDRGHILFLKDSQHIERSWVIIDKKYMLEQVSGSIFAPEHFKQHKVITECTCSTGVVPLSSIASSFPEHNPELLIKFLSCLEFCSEIFDPEILHHITAEHQICIVNQPSCVTKERYFLFPALVSLNVPSNIWNDNSDCSHNCGWILHCSNYKPEQFLTSRFLQVLLLRIGFSFPLSQEHIHHSHPAIQRNCSIWKNGIFWGNDCGVETLVEVLPDNKAVIVLMRCRDAALVSMVQLRSQVLRHVLKAVDDFCNSITTVESFIDPTDCRQYPLRSLSQLKLFDMMNISRAISNAKLNTIHTLSVVCPTGTILLEKLLLYEPYIELGEDILEDLFESEDYEPSAEIISDAFLSQAAEMMSKSQHHDIFIQTFVSVHETHTTAATPADILSALKTWRAGCAGTYKCLREKLDEFSVFAERNLLTLTGKTERKKRSKPEISPLKLPSTHEASVKEVSNVEKPPVKGNKPTLELLEVLKYGGERVKVIESVAAQWEQLAIALGFDPPVIDYLRRDFNHDSKGAATKVLTKWLNGESDLDQPITWNTLIQCLEDAEHGGLADVLADLLTE